MSEEKIFADGFSFKKRENAPDFVVGRVSIKIEDAIPFLKENANEQGWLSLHINQARSGKYYMELDTFVPKSRQKTEATPQVEKKEEPLPF